MHQQIAIWHNSVSPTLTQSQGASTQKGKLLNAQIWGGFFQVTLEKILAAHVVLTEMQYGAASPTTKQEAEPHKDLI